MNDHQVDIRAVLEKAAASPDPAVRNLAIRHGRLRQELETIDSFFAFYGSVHAEPIAVQAKPKPKVVNGGGGGGSDDFVLRVCEVLKRHGTPMRISHLYEVFFETYSDMTKTAPDTFRQRLFKRRNRIQLIEGIGYWPADTPVPTLVKVEEAIAA